MAISKNSSIDFAKIALEMREIVARWYNAEVQIIEPNTRELDAEWDPTTNTYVQAVDTVVWSGKARVQPIKAERMPDLGVMQGAIQSVRIQVPYDADLSLVKKGMRVKITNGGEDHVLEGLDLVVRAAINSSYGWNRTIECDADVRNG